MKYAACVATWGPCAHSVEMDLVVYIVVDDVTGLWENLAGMVTYIFTLLAELCDPV